MKTAAAVDLTRDTIIYPVYSRRSGGVSAGINLFPGGKVCSFDCSYCEVFPFKTDLLFSLELMESALVSCLAGKANVSDSIECVRDVCFSGTGEPTMSPYFIEALETARSVRDTLAPGAKLVLITNGTGLFDEALFATLVREAKRGLNIWIKFDAGTKAWFQTINRPHGVSFNALLERIKAFAETGAPCIIQTMICSVNGVPSAKNSRTSENGNFYPAEEAAWLRLVTELAVISHRADPDGGIRAVQIYGKSRPAPDDPLAQAALPELLERRAVLLQAALNKAGLSFPVGVYL